MARTRGTGNVFADLGFPGAAERQAKLRLAYFLNQVLEQRKFLQPDAAKVLGVTRPKVSALRRYKLEGFSVERLMNLLTALDQDVEIVIRRKPRSRKAARISVFTHSAQSCYDRNVFALAIIIALAVPAAPQAPPTGSLVGCASDTMKQRLPAVTVVAKTGRVQRTTTADAGGCYELRDLPTGSYRVTARLTGFDSVTRDGVIIAPTGVARMDFDMRVSPICECVRLGGTTLAGQWDYADAVLHLRLSASEPQPTTPLGYYRHAAPVLDVLKKPVGQLATPVFVLQNQRSAAAGPMTSTKSW
jgi:predicted XRE-type DNA-binding protein